jgi:hypothetical protein
VTSGQAPRAPAERIVNSTTALYSRKLDLDNRDGERK